MNATLAEIIKIFDENMEDLAVVEVVSDKTRYMLPLGTVKIKDLDFFLKRDILELHPVSISEFDGKILISCFTGDKAEKDGNPVVKKEVL